MVDAIIILAILAAIGGGIKIVKDNRKLDKINWWWLGFEILIVCGTLFWAIYGRASQFAKDSEKLIAQNGRQDSGLRHTDTSIISSSKAIQDSANARARRMEDTIRAYRTQISEDRKPYIDINPIANDFNPHIDLLGSDSISMKCIYLNCGTSFAKELHTKHLDLIETKNDSLIPAPDCILLKLNSNESIRPFCMKQGIQDFTVVICKHASPDEFLIHCVAFCYKDSTNRHYGPIYRMFQWRIGDWKKQPYMLSDDEYQAAKKAFIRVGIWPTKFF
jgi:hypothetical protein